MTFDPRTRSPTLRKLLKTRLAPVREKELFTKALSQEKPVKPAAGDCCGSSCKPCVMDLYREELKVWKECWVLTELDESTEVEESLRAAREAIKEQIGSQQQEERLSIPGAFEW